MADGICILLDIYWNILTMHVPIKVKSLNNTSKWQMGFNSAFKGLNYTYNSVYCTEYDLNMHYVALR
jgi:hypothetical protein